MCILLTYSVRDATPETQIRATLRLRTVLGAVVCTTLSSIQTSSNLRFYQSFLVFAMSSFRTFTPREVEARIAAGDTLVIFRGHVLRLNNWQDVHPGGRLVIQHMVGRDASDELSM